MSNERPTPDPQRAPLRRLWGIPYVVWGALALAVAVVWVFVWPSDKAAGVTALQYLILRWAHALVWLFLAAAAFALSSPRGERAARILGYLALGTYAAFMVVMLTAP